MVKVLHKKLIVKIARRLMNKLSRQTKERNFLSEERRISEIERFFGIVHKIN